jgi:UDP-glucose 4-epimerase
MSQHRSILVTGGLGFIGSHLCRALLHDQPGLELTIVDNLSSTQMDYGDLNGRAQIFIQDMLDFESSQKFQEIYHLASPVGSLGILERNGYVAREILALTYKAVELALASRARLLFVSSSEVYGQDGVSREDAPKIISERQGTRVEYSLGKLLSEHILFNLALEHDLQFKICRPFSVIGAGQSSRIGFVVPTFFERALAGEEIPVFYGGAQRRSFCHVSDAVTAIMAVQQRGRAGHIYNIGNPGAVTSIRGLAEKIVSLCSSKSRIVSVDPQELYGKQYIEAFEKIPNVAKIRQHTGWEPKLDLDASLKEILSCYLAERVC